MTKLLGTEHQCQDRLEEKQREKTLRKQQTVTDTLVAWPGFKPLV